MTSYNNFENGIKIYVKYSYFRDPMQKIYC